MGDRKSRLMARNILKQLTPDAEQQKKKKAKGVQEEAVQEEQAKIKSGEGEDAEREATEGHAEDQTAELQSDRDLPSLAGDLKRKRAPRGAARNVKQKMDGEAQADPKTVEPAEDTAAEGAADEGTVSKPTEEGQGKELSAGALEAADGGMSRRESSRLRMKPVKFREIIPTLGAKLKATEDGKLKGLESQLPVEVQALEEGHITIGRDRISDVYRRRDKKKVVPAKTDNLPVEQQKEAKLPAIDKKDAKSPVVEKESKQTGKEENTAAADKKGEKKEIKSCKEARSSPGDKKEAKVAPVEKKEAKPPSTQERKDARTPAKTPAKDSKLPNSERKDAKTPVSDKKEGRPPPVERKDSKTPAVEKKGGKIAAADKKDGKLGASERKDGQIKIAIKVKPPIKAADPAMVDVPLKDSDENGLKAALQAVKRVMKLKEAEPFNAPVNPIALHIPDYFDVIKDPMDLGTIREMLEKGRKYQNTEDVLRDVHLVWSNCRKYNNDTDPVVELMQTVENAFIKHWTAAGLQYVPPKKLTAKALLGYTVSGSEKAGKSEQLNQKQTKGQVDPKLQIDLHSPAEKVASERKTVTEKKAQAPKEPAEELRSSRQRKPAKSVHFEGVSPSKSKKRSAPVEQVMAESMAREQRASPKETREPLISDKETTEVKVAADAAAEQTEVAEIGAENLSCGDKPDEQRGPVEEASERKVTTSKRAERAGARLSKRQKLSKAAVSPRQQADEQQGGGKDGKINVPQVPEVATDEGRTNEVRINDVTTNEVTINEATSNEVNSVAVEKGEGEILSVAHSSDDKPVDEKPADEKEADSKDSAAVSRDDDKATLDFGEKDSKTLFGAEGDMELSSNAVERDEKIIVLPEEERIDTEKFDEVAIPTDEQENRDSKPGASEHIEMAETAISLNGPDDGMGLSSVEELNESNTRVVGDENFVSTVESQDGKISVSANSIVDEDSVAHAASVQKITCEIIPTLEKGKEVTNQGAGQSQDDQVSNAEKSIQDRTESTPDDRSKRERVGLKGKAERSSKGRDEKSHSSSKKGKDHRSHTSDKRKEIRSHGSSKGRDDRKSHSSRDRGIDGQTAKKKDEISDTSVPRGKDGKPEAVSLRRRDDKTVAGDSNVKTDAAKSGSSKRDDAKKDDKAGAPNKDDKSAPPKKDDKATPPKKDDKSLPPKKDDKSLLLKKDDKSAPPKKDDKSKRINGTQHHREDCPCVVCKGRRRKLAGIANAERKEKRKLLALQEGATKKSKLPIREQKQLLEESQKDGKASVTNDEVDGWETDDHFGELFEGDCSEFSEAENVRFYPASYKVPPRKLSALVYNMSTALFGSNPQSLWSKRQLLRFQPAQTVRSPLFQEICSLVRNKGC